MHLFRPPRRHHWDRRRRRLSVDDLGQADNSANAFLKALVMGTGSIIDTVLCRTLVINFETKFKKGILLASRKKGFIIFEQEKLFCSSQEY